ncbi:hypothetical protein [Candidatus Chlorohelix sp.]|uniref:hypothetical protein n=1 Tax=Candidatus Chlorohelix sp. TaxID=3139201 RepID=UPI00303228ED
MGLFSFLAPISPPNLPNHRRRIIEGKSNLPQNPNLRTRSRRGDAGVPQFAPNHRGRILWEVVH